MSDSVIDEFRDDFALMIEAGFIAVKQFNETCATKLFQAASILDSESSAPDLGFGYIALNKLETEKAMVIFQGILEKEPDHHLAQTFLGICLLLNKGKRADGEKMIEEAMKKSDDPSIKNLGKTSLTWAENDLKNKKPPFFSSE